MPELPEVESLRVQLEPKLKGARLAALVFRRPDLRYPLPVGREAEIAGHAVTALRRRSKYLLWDFDNGVTLVLHLGMSGRLFFTPREAPLDRHDHVLFDWQDGRHLRFRDPRRFGMLFLRRTDALPGDVFFRDLGVEPLDASFDADYLFARTRRSRAPLKSWLMDAKNLVGVGNIYANEALFLSGIRPSRRASRLSRDDAKTLCANVKKVLKRSIERGGTSFRDYVDADQQPGLYGLSLFVYGRAGEPCRRCNASIKRLRHANRGTFYCPRCQS